MSEISADSNQPRSSASALSQNDPETQSNSSQNEVEFLANSSQNLLVSPRFDIFLEVYRTKIFSNIILPLEKLKRNLNIMNMNEIILMLEHLFMLGNYLRDNNLTGMTFFVLYNDMESAIRFFETITFVLQHVFDIRYGELIEKYDSHKVDLMNLQSNSLRNMLDIFHNYCHEHTLNNIYITNEEFNTIIPIMNRLRKLLFLLMGRHCAYYKRNAEREKSKAFHFRSEYCKLYSEWVEKGKSPSNIWNMTHNDGKKLTKREYIEMVLRNYSEDRCTICLCAPISMETDFSILNCCSHLFCVQCAETEFFKTSNNKG